MKTNKCFQINNRNIGIDYEPYIVAELSANHNQSLDKALSIINMAKIVGADAVKIQTYLPDTITINCSKNDFIINQGLWKGYTLYELYEIAHTPWEWHESLFEYARKIGITLFSSPFDNTAVDLLEDLNSPAYKIASFEAIDIPLIRYTASTKKPLIISTGMASADEINEAITAAREAGCENLALLHCVSGYPSPPEDYNLRTIVDMKKRYNVVVGLSDHCINNSIAIASIALGASIIEKHITLDRKCSTPDCSFSLEPYELEQLCNDSKFAWRSLGSINYERKNSEKENVIFRKSLYIVESIKKGEMLTKKNIKSIRPGYGIAPKYYDMVIGKKAICDLSKGTPLTFDLIDNE